MMALSMTFASLVAMNAPCWMASRIGRSHRDPMSASCGNQLRKEARSLATIIWQVKNLKTMAQHIGRWIQAEDLAWKPSKYLSNLNKTAIYARTRGMLSDVPTGNEANRGLLAW
jgi:hypothetical protein